MNRPPRHVIKLAQEGAGRRHALARRHQVELASKRHWKAIAARAERPRITVDDIRKRKGRRGKGGAFANQFELEDGHRLCLVELAASQLATTQGFGHEVEQLGIGFGAQNRGAMLDGKSGAVRKGNLCRFERQRRKKVRSEIG